MINVFAILIMLMFTTVSTGAVEYPLLNAMKNEMKRTMDGLANQSTPPYFLSYAVTETKTIRMNAVFGSVKSSEQTLSRILDIDIRVGNHELDNTHTIRGSRFEFGEVGELNFQ